jgi:hypothetical protein
MSPETPKAFRVIDCAMTILSLGRSAQNLRELREHVATVPVQSIAHHFHDSLLRPSFDHPQYRNDFARWADRQLHDSLLAERLGILDPLDHPDMEAVRQAMLDVIEDRLAEAPVVPQAERGKEFYFLRSQFVILDTGKAAETPEQLAAMIPGLSTGSVFYHFIEARRRPPLGTDDFSAWLQAWGPRYAPWCARLAGVDYSLWSLTELRERIAACLAAAMGETGAS